MATSFLDLARLESGRVQFQKSAFSLQQVVEECKSIVQNKADESHITIKVKVPEDMPPVSADRDMNSPLE